MIETDILLSIFSMEIYFNFFILVSFFKIRVWKFNKINLL